MLVYILNVNIVVIKTDYSLAFDKDKNLSQMLLEDTSGLSLFKF